MMKSNLLRVEVLGSGCSKCDDTLSKVKQILNEFKVEAELTKFPTYLRQLTVQHIRVIQKQMMS